MRVPFALRIGRGSLSVPSLTTGFAPLVVLTKLEPMMCRMPDVSARASAIAGALADADHAPPANAPPNATSVAATRSFMRVLMSGTST
jgi:hypothetical protein